MAIYRDLYLKIANRIVNGDFAAGEKLPSSAELARQYNISYITAHKVYELLCRNNLVEARRGQGFFVRMPSTPNPAEKPLQVGKIGLLLSLVDNTYSDFHQKLVVRLLNSGYAPTALGFSWMMKELSQESAEQILLSYAASGIETLIIRGDAHFPYKALYAVRNAFRKIIFVKMYSGEMEFPGADKILFDMHKAGFLAATHLLENNFNKLVFLTQEPAREEIRRRHGVSGKLFDLEMLDGIEDACGKYDIDFYATGKIIARNMPYRENENLVRQSIDSALDAGYNGFVCMNDIRALLVYQAAAERGLKINKDIGIVGNFNTHLGESLSPKLCSVDSNIPTLIESVISAVTGNIGNTPVWIEPKLIKRK